MENSRAASQPPKASGPVVASLKRVQAALHAALTALPAGRMDLRALAAALASRGLTVTLRTGLSVGPDCKEYLSTLRHQSLIVHPEEPGGLFVIVDPAFREQFAVAGVPAQSQYAAAVAALPSIFLGTISTLTALINLLSSTLVNELQEIPPWRTKSALLSKWLPRRFADVVFTSHVPLHPALRSSLHGAHSGSPQSVSSWLSSRSSSTSQQLESIDNAACGGAGAHAASGYACHVAAHDASLHAPAHVVAGFADPAPPAAASPCDPGATTCTGVARAKAQARSALTAQLAAASAAAPTAWGRVAAAVPQQTKGCWQQLAPTPAAPPQPLQQQQAAIKCTISESVRKAACKAGKGDDLPSGIIISPVHKRTSAVAPKRCSATPSLKLSSATLKLLPKIYTVKLPVPSTAAC